MAALGIVFMYLVQMGAGSDVYLASNDGLNPFGLGFLIKINDTVHSPVVCNGHSSLPQFYGGIYQLGDTSCPIQQTVFTMHMQMNKSAHCVILLFLFIHATESRPNLKFPVIDRYRYVYKLSLDIFRNF